MGYQGRTGNESSWPALIFAAVLAVGLLAATVIGTGATSDYKPPEKVAKVVAKKHVHTGPAFLIVGAESRYFFFAADGTSVQVTGYTFNRVEVGQEFSAIWENKGQTE